VNFDYGYLREAYRQLGLEFKRKKLCTVQLSRRAFPGLPSYSLDKITRELGIQLPGHHRAAVDAKATMLLFEKILAVENEKGLFDTHAGIPDTDRFASPFIDKDFLSSIPDDCGVYRFYDKEDKLLFVKRAENVLTSICDKLNQTDTQTAEELRQKLYRIDYELTGSGLLAQLLEADEVMSHTPEFNFGKFSMKALFGLYKRRTDEKQQLILMKRRRGSRPERVFANFYEGLDFLKGVAEQSDAEITQIPYGRKTVPGIDLDTGGTSNSKNGMSRYLILDEGRHVMERTLILVEKDVVVGYGYFDSDVAITDFERDDVQFAFHAHPELEMVVRKFVEKKRFERILHLS
jgi:DNA polymerase-3 subunit epsilon